MCIVKGDKMILKAVLQDNLYERIEEFQGERDFYIPTVDEILDYAKTWISFSGCFLSQIIVLPERDELHLEEEKTEELFTLCSKSFLWTDAFDIMEEFK